ncbi:MAG TPA: DUF4333 domain-containing protein [Solirubrobacterales bacterium]|nr:DUF4333 domain-containing protein [Solirubrobacterales bacterium]
MRTRRFALPSLVVLFGLIFALAACGGITGIDEALVDTAPEELDVESAECPDDVEEEVGTEFECTATTGDGEEYTVPGEITAIDGDEAETTFDFSEIAGSLSGATGASGSE